MFQGLRGKRVLITGSSGGIGASLARLFASHGASVGLHFHRNKRTALALHGEIAGAGGQAVCLPADFLDPSDCRRLVQAFLRRFGRIDVLINNAGGPVGPTHFLRLKESFWDQTFALNVKAPFFLARQAFRTMKENGGGKIINISSVSAKYGGSPQSLHYAAAKAALEAVTVGLARAGASHNILVNTIRAGVVDTPLHRKMGRDSLKDRIRLIPLKRIGQPIDIARMALFLASEAGDYITGEVFSVSGGD